MKLIIVPLTRKEDMSAKALLTLEKASPLYLQTKEHVFTRTFACENTVLMDDLYESAADYDILHEEIAARIFAGGKDCVYGCLGDFQRTKDAFLKLDPENTVEVLPNVPFYMSAFPELHADETVTADMLPMYFNAGKSICVSEIHNSICAGDVKLKLTAYYPDETEVLFAIPDKNGTYKRKTIPLYELDRLKRYDAASCLYVPGTVYENRNVYGMEDFLAIMDRLRAPGGCPWDREQTHESIRKDMIEECYEVVDAIDKNDDTLLCEELGDILMQVVFHSAIANDQGAFAFKDVVDGIAKKMVFRHPHVFKKSENITSEQVLVNWDKLKQEEKQIESIASDMERLPKAFPALIRAHKAQKKAAKVGFDWEKAEDALEKVKEETEEVEEAMKSQGNIEEEVGDLFFAVVNVARLLKLDSEEILQKATEKFITRFGKTEKLIREAGKSFSGMSLEEMDEYWDRAKKCEKLGI